MLSGNRTGDAVFLPAALRPGRPALHGAEHLIYVVNYNEGANDGAGCYDILQLDADEILELADLVQGDSDAFFSLLPDRNPGSGYYANRGSELFEAIEELYEDADFLQGRDGGEAEELAFMVHWAGKI